MRANLLIIPHFAPLPIRTNDAYICLSEGEKLTNIRDNVACGGALLQGVPTLLPKIHTYPHLKGIYLSIETYIPFVRYLYTFCAKPIYLSRSGCDAVERGAWGVGASQQWGAVKGIGAVLQYFTTFAAAGWQKRSVYPYEIGGGFGTHGAKKKIKTKKRYNRPVIK